jgi:hypothetical protein
MAKLLPKQFSSGRTSQQTPAMYMPTRVGAGWGRWLGTENINNKDREFRSYEDARTFVRSLKLRTSWIGSDIAVEVSSHGHPFAPYTSISRPRLEG